MSRRRLPTLLRAAVVALPILVQGCAESPTEPGTAGHNAAQPLSGGQQTVPGSSGPDAPLRSLPAERVAQAMADRCDLLAGVFPKEIAGGIATRPRLDGAVIVMQMDSGALFDSSTAQFKPEALAALSRFAKWERADGTLVIHVEGRETLQTVDDLMSRRAASVADFMVREGAPPSRIRARGVPYSLVSPPGGASAIIAFTLVPVVSGAEARAWMDPVSFARNP